jgi:hypothetical protein
METDTVELCSRIGGLFERRSIYQSSKTWTCFVLSGTYLFKEDSQRFWDYKSGWWASKFTDNRCKRIMRSRIEPMQKVARMLRSHRSLILNYFRAKEQIAQGADKAKVTTKKPPVSKALKL